MSESIGVVCFQWNNGFRKYRPDYVNRLARGVRRHLPLDHTFYCITDETEGFSSDVVVFKTPEKALAVGNLPSPEGPRFPASYRRLWAFSKDAKQLADRILLLDIDCIISGDLAPLFEPQDDFVGWRPDSVWGVSTRIGGGTWLLRTGTKSFVWDEFSPKEAGKARAAGYRGSDQAYMSYKLGADVAVWPQNIGIYQAQQVKGNGFRTCPKDARIVHFNGKVKPWDLVGKINWITEQWR